MISSNIYKSTASWISTISSFVVRLKQILFAFKRKILYFWKSVFLGHNATTHISYIDFENDYSILHFSANLYAKIVGHWSQSQYLFLLKKITILLTQTNELWIFLLFWSFATAIFETRKKNYRKRFYRQNVTNPQLFGKTIPVISQMKNVLRFPVDGCFEVSRWPYSQVEKRIPTEKTPKCFSSGRMPHVV